MKTNQIMKRTIGGAEVSQRTGDSYFNATDLLRCHNKKDGTDKRMREFMTNKNTQDFLESLKNELNLNSGKSSYLESDLFSVTRGKMGATWMHPYLFVKFAIWLSTDLEVKVIKAVYDNLIQYRNDAGDFYKEMCAAIYERYIEFYEKKPDHLIFMKEANFLNQLVFGDARSRQRNEVTEEQLKLMTSLQKINIGLIKNKISSQERYAALRSFAQMYHMAQNPSINKLN